MEEKKNVITYGLRDFRHRGRCIVVQKMNGHDINEYVAYDHHSYFALYPRRRIVPSPIPLEKHDVSICNVKREC